MNKEKKPYVVSADITKLLTEWSKKRDFLLPSSDVFSQLRADFIAKFRLIFSQFDFVLEDELSNGISNLVRDSGSMPISLDRVYFQTNYYIDTTREIDQSKKNKGIGARDKKNSLLAQLRNIQNADLREAVLVDDVIYSGDLATRVVKGLRRIGIEIPLFVTGIGIRQGVDRLRSNGVRVSCVREYDQVIDEICERDFYPGVCQSGRTVEGQQNIGAPYILPFGDPVKWASIPSQRAVNLSKFCIDNTINLFETIEVVSNKQVRCCDLDRKVIGLPKDETRFVDALKNTINLL